MKLTLQQQDIYYEQLLNPNKPIYNIGAKISIKGSIDINALKEAYIELINQHDAYRIILTHCNEEVEVDVINPHHTELDCLDLSGNPNPEMAANDFMQIEFLKPFDLHSGKLLHRFLLIKVDDDFHYLFSVYHHIITDGWGTSLMFQRLVSNYNEILEFGKTKSEFPYAYENFVKNDIEYYHSEGYQRDKEYWLDKYNSLPESFLNRIDDTKEISISKREVLIIKRKAYNQLNSLAKENRVSTFHIILAVLFTYFGRNHQIEDMSIGLPVLNRSKAIFKKTVGLFMGVSPLRVQLDFEKSFLDLILLIKKQLRQDYRHQRFPLGKLINELQLFKEKSRLFNITLSYEKQDYSINFSNTETRVIPLSHQSERVALAVYIREFDEAEDVTIDFDYNVNYFQAKDAQKTIRHIEKIIEKILDEPSINLKEIEYLTEQEIQQFNHDFKGEDLIIPKQLTFIDYFLKQVEHNPNKLAVRDRGVSYTYLETEELSNNIAKNIDYLTDGKKTTIGVQLSRRADLIIVLLGILKSGNAYIPLDPSFPKERLNYILTESKADLLIIEDESVEYIGSQTKLVSVEQIFEINLKNDLGFNLPTSSDTAYIIYTSGSTGKPKGVEILHYSLLNFLLSICEKPGINKNDSLYAVTTFSFDISILEFFIPLVSGATLYIAHQETLADPFNAAKDIIKINPTIIQGTPSFYQMLFNAGWVGNNNLKILCGGDLLSEQLAGRLMDNSQEVWNMYGPTETTIWSSTKKIEKAKDASNIGAAIHNTQFFILDKYMKKLPVGVAGNIYIGGDGLAKGYYRNEELTKRKFIDYQNGIGRRDIYETGDIGQWNEEGEIQFLGRNDNQVKIRGYRIELGDVEDSLNQINEISESVVVVKKGHDSSLLVAYVVKKNDIKIKEIKSFLSLKLPQYMVPEIYVFIDSFPLTPNKKINRKLLSKRDINYEENRKQLEFPRTKIENKISDIWKSILNIKEPINIDSSFFALGGHSLNAVKLAGGIYKEFNCNITLRNIFENSSIRELSRCIQNEGDLEKTPIILKAKNKIGYPLTPSQYQIWLASQKENVSKAYNLFAAYEVDGILDVNIIEQSLGIIVRKFETLRTNFVEENGQVFQRINDEIDISISLLNIKTGEIDDFY